MVIPLLILLYTLVIIVMLNRILRGRQIGLSRTEIALAFSFKVVLGILYGYIFKKYFEGDDTWNYFNDSLQEYNKLLFQTGNFFKEFLSLNSFSKYPAFADCFRDFLENGEYNIITKSLAFFNLLSLQNYYVDVVFFNLFSFGGCYLLFKLFSGLWPGKRLLVYVSAFLIPSTVFWLSGIRGDGCLLLAIAMVLYYFNAWIGSRKAKHFLLMTAGLIGTLIFRSQFMLILLPWLPAWWLSVRNEWKPWKVFIITYAVSLLIFFGSTLFSSGINLPITIVRRQAEFMQLHGKTVLQLNRLQPDVRSFIMALPQASVNTFLRPYPWEAKDPLQLAASIEIIFFWIVAIVAAFKIRTVLNLPITWVLLFFSLSTYLLIGYTVPYPGAIVRYKIIPELLLLILFVPNLPIRLKKYYI